MQPALPRSAGRGRCPGDMMIDWVSPPAGMRPLSLIRPSALRLLVDGASLAGMAVSQVVALRGPGWLAL